MSDERYPISIEADLPGEWLYLAARVDIMLFHEAGRRERSKKPTIRWTTGPVPSGIQFSVRADVLDLPLLLTLTTTNDKTHIEATEIPPFKGFWAPILSDITHLARQAWIFRHSFVEWTFNEVLDQYYIAQEMGMKVTLRALAQAAGVNYDSLRQAKITYDRKRREENASGD